MKNALEKIAADMGLESKELAESLAGTINQMAAHTERRGDCVERALEMLEAEAGLPATNDTALALLDFIAAHSGARSLCGRAAATFALRLGESADAYDLTYTEDHVAKVEDYVAKADVVSDA